MEDGLLVLNSGSSSLKFALFTAGDTPLVRGQIERLTAGPHFMARDRDGRTVGEQSWEPERQLSHPEAAAFLFDWGRKQLGEIRIAAAGHRVVHGGMRFVEPVRIDETVLGELEKLSHLAPLHQTQNLAAIRTIAELAPDVPQVACFDTAFHSTQSGVARAYALPRQFTDEGICRYGFHGLSYEYIATTLAGIDPRAASGRAVIAHLGNGASMCATRGGRSVATTMGFSALDGLPMSTRPGALDPGVVIYLMDHYGLDARGLERLFYYESGLLGVSGVSGDVRTLLDSADPHAAKAIELLVYRIGRELGSLTAALGGLDALIFTGGVGENAAPIRARVCQGAAWLGLELDEAANAAGETQISRPGSRVAAWVIPTNEELTIARHTLRVLNGS